MAEEAANATTRDRLRSVLRWLLAAYGAIAVLLVAGAQLQGIADVTGWVAVPTFGGLALALGGVLWVLATGAHALSVGRISITELTAATGTAATAPTGTRRQRRDRADVQTVRVILDAHLTVAGPGFHDVATLAAAHREAWTDWSELRNLEVFLGNQQTLSATRAIVGVAGYEPLRSEELFWFARSPGDAETPREVALRRGWRRRWRRSPPRTAEPARTRSTPCGCWPRPRRRG